MRRPVPLPPPSGVRVAVLTAFVPGAEPIEMLEQTLTALIDLEYRHDTWVLDEGDDFAVSELCARVGALHFSRKQYNQFQALNGHFQVGSKHGNYNAWLAVIGFERYDFIAAFDVDHIPKRSFLIEVLGYFLDDAVGYVQAAQAYYNQNASFIARGAAEETYDFYSTLQMANYAMGYSTIIGCHNTHRVSALRQVGGFAPHDADDLLLTLLYRNAGWHGVYVPKILARGIAPVDWDGYLKQQRRWSRSVLDIKLRLQWNLVGNLPQRSRVVAVLHGLNYLQPCLTALFGVTVLAALLAGAPAPGAIEHPAAVRILSLFVAMGLCNWFRQRFYLCSRERGVPWRAWLLRTAKWPFVLAALLDVISRRQLPYLMTRKMRSISPKSHLLRYHLPSLAILITAWAIGIHRGAHVSIAVVTFAIGLGLLLCGLITTEYIRYPDPFDVELARSVQRSFRAGDSGPCRETTTEVV